MSLPALPPMRVPTLTEVVDWPPLQLVMAEAPVPAQADEYAEDTVELCVDETAELTATELTTVELTKAEPNIAPSSEATHEPLHPLADVPRQESSAHELAPTPSSPVIDEAALTQRLLADLQQQIDSMLDHQLRVAMQPLLNRLADTLAQQARDQVASALRDMVALAVSREMIRLRAEAPCGDSA